MVDFPTVPREVAREVARDLLSIGAVSLAPSKPFLWASGRRSPVYCDNRLTLGHPAVRMRICRAFVERLSFKDWRIDAVVGTATAGIPHAAWLAHELDVPMAYVRSSAKAHGRENRVEGHITPGSRVVVVEDLVSTGMSSTSVLPPLREAGLTVAGVVAIFTYGLDVAEEAFVEAGVPLETLSSFPVLIQVAADEGDMTEEDLASLQEWYRDPSGWSVSHGGSE